MKTLFASLLLLLFTFSTTAQENRSERIKALKTAFIIQELDLSQSESEKFWPVYNKYENEIRSLKKQERTEVKKSLKEDLENLSDAQAKEILNKIKNFKNLESELQNQKDEELLKILSAKKVLLLKKAEHDFQMQLLKKYRGGEKK